MYRVLILMILSCALIGSPVKARQSDPASKQAPQTQSDKNNGATHPPVQAATGDPNYLIGPSDELNIDVFENPNVSRTVPVRPDGKISLPLLNDIQAAGQTPMQLAAVITEKLSKFEKVPQVTVIVIAINSQRVYLIGEVVRTGAYPILPNMTVLQALSSAGGFTVYAKQSGVFVLRMENGHQIKFPFNYKDVVSGKKPEQNIVLKAGDQIVVP
jgi:polysaccharide export outer membrane protein